MSDIPRLSRREQEVLALLQAGKSNKLIASALSISDRTVEFHLKNIYAKFHVASRMELVVKLGYAPSNLETQNLGYSTVAGAAEDAENNHVANRSDWRTSLKQTVSLISKEVRMKQSWTAPAHNGGDPLSFAQAIRVCLAKYADFTGRASRSEFWWFVLFIVLVASAVASLSEAWGSVFSTAMLLPLLAAGTRRLNDVGKSPWWQLFLLVPFGGLVIVGWLWALAPTDSVPTSTAV